MSDGIKISASIQDEGAATALTQLLGRTENLTPLMDNLGAALLLSTQMRFEDEQAPDGSPWPQSIRAKVTGGKTLRDSNRLYQSLTYRASETGIELGTNVIYAALQQFGGKVAAKNAKALRFRMPGGRWVTRKSVDIPARPFLGIDDADQTEIGHIVADYLRVAQ